MFHFALLALVTLLVATSAPIGMSAQQRPVVHGFGVAKSGLVPGRDFVPGEVVVGLHRGVPAAAANTIAAAVSGRVARRLDGDDPVALVRFSDEARVQQAIAVLGKQHGVRFIERNGIVSIPLLPAPAVKEGRHRLAPAGGVVSRDPESPQQWHLTVIRKTAALGALALRPPTIAVIDSGVDYTHPDLSNNVLMGKNCVDDTMDPFDDHGHGTHVAGIAAARSGNGVAGEGVARGSRILAVKVLDSTAFGTFFEIVCGLRYARTVRTSPPTRVGNLSVAGPESASLASEVENWKAAGKVLVVAAGNGNDTGARTFNRDPHFALRVMATEQHDCRASFSTFSPARDPERFNIAAPGFAIVSTLPGDRFGTMHGTSMATPIVAATAALVWGHEPDLTREAVVRRLIATGKPITCGFAAPTRRVDVRHALLGTPESAVIGRIVDGASGRPIAAVTPSVEVLEAGVVVGSAVTDAGGSYEVVDAGLAGSARRLKVAAHGYIPDPAARRSVTVSTSAPTGPFTDGVMRRRGAGVFQVALDWSTTQPDTTAAGADTMGWDLDLVLQPPGMRGDWVGPGPEGALGTPPFYRVFRDSFTDSEPVEALAIAPRAADGTYRILVRRYTGPENARLHISRADVRLYDDDSGVMAARAIACTAAQPFWHVANVRKRGATYMVTPVGVCRATPP